MLYLSKLFVSTLLAALYFGAKRVLDTPPSHRGHKLTATGASRPIFNMGGTSNEEFLDIPAFLRRQAD